MKVMGTDIPDNISPYFGKITTLKTRLSVSVMNRWHIWVKKECCLVKN